MALLVALTVVTRQGEGVVILMIVAATLTVVRSAILGSVKGRPQLNGQHPIGLLALMRTVLMRIMAMVQGRTPVQD